MLLFPFLMLSLVFAEQLKRRLPSIFYVFEIVIETIKHKDKAGEKGQRAAVDAKLTQLLTTDRIPYLSLLLRRMASYSSQIHRIFHKMLAVETTFLWNDNIFTIIIALIQFHSYLLFA